MTNWQLIIALATLVFAIFGANWLNQRQTERLIEELGRRFDAKFDGLRAELKAEIGTVKTELKVEIGALSQKVDRIERQLDAMLRPVLPKV